MIKASGQLGGRPFMLLGLSGPFQVHLRLFAQHFGIDLTGPRRHSVRVDDGVLCIDLKAEG